MIPKIKKILYATDLSPNSIYAMRYAMNEVIKHNADIVILNVFEKWSAANPTVLGTYLDEPQHKKIFDDYTAETQDLVKQRLQIIYDEELQDHPEYADKNISIEVAEGFPAELILSKAQELDCDAIIMGTHGKGVLANTFLGSTAKRVLRRTRKPVFIIPLPKEKTVDISQEL
jgi:nucleotide-binding universal stress UspA family protein